MSPFPKHTSNITDVHPDTQHFTWVLGILTPYVCAVSTLLTEPSPQLTSFLLMV